MKLKRLRALLEAYGADPARWPSDERVAASQLLQANSVARAFRSSQQTLDDALDTWEPEVPVLDMRIFEAQLPPREVVPDLLDRLLAWLVPDREAAWWGPVTEATCTLVVGVLLGSSLTAVPEQDTNKLVDNWDDEIYLLGLGASLGVGEDASP